MRVFFNSINTHFMHYVLGRIGRQKNEKPVAEIKTDSVGEEKKCMLIFPAYQRWCCGLSRVVEIPFSLLSDFGANSLAISA